MLHPSYSDLMKVVNSEVEPGEAPVVNSRYSIVMATSKRARQLIAGEDALIEDEGKKPLSVAVEELNQGKIKILCDEDIQSDRKLIVNYMPVNYAGIFILKYRPQIYAAAPIHRRQNGVLYENIICITWM